VERVKTGGHRYSDPDVLALIRAGGGLADPRSLVLTQARKLNQQYRMFDSPDVTPFERLVHIASIIGFKVEPMDTSRRRDHGRDAVILLNGSPKGRGGRIFYNPDRPNGRVAFSIAHEISHTFFPSTTGGARFREMCGSDSREANELERLCDLGASELLMPVDEFRSTVSGNWSIRSVPQLSQHFGASFEATTFRLASAHPGIAAAGLLKYRRRKEEQQIAERAEAAKAQALLFSSAALRPAAVPEPKYRRQSFHASDQFPEHLTIRWNKSFDEGSVVYRAANSVTVSHGDEALPNGMATVGRLEAITAPYQRDDADPSHPDQLFFWTET
jgi:Zn-dependent peptidase ImmA (M78 family)